MHSEENWDNIILPKKSLFAIDFKEIWKYRDLLLMFVKRDFVTLYKQTILGPIWFFFSLFLLLPFMCLYLVMLPNYLPMVLLKYFLHVGHHFVELFC